MDSWVIHEMYPHVEKPTSFAFVLRTVENIPTGTSCKEPEPCYPGLNATGRESFRALGILSLEIVC